MRRHRFDPFSLVAGLLFGFIALFFLGGHRTNDLAWPWAAVIPLIAIGLLIVLLGLRRAFARDPLLPPRQSTLEAEGQAEGEEHAEPPLD